MIRTLTLAFLFPLALAALHGQDVRAYLFLADAPLTVHDQKMIYEALTGLDERIAISLEPQRVKARTHSGVTAAEMLAALQAHGVQLRLPGEVPTADELRAGAPLPWVAAAANADAAALQAAKEAWIQAHPDAYLQMQQGVAPAPERLTPSDQ